MFREKEILNLVRGKHILDIGSVGQTESYNLWELYKSVEFKSLTGIDLPGVKTTTEEVFSRKVDDSDSRIIFGDMETYEFNRKFDIAVAGDVIEHVNNQGLFLQNIHRHLEDNGKFVFTTPNAKWPTVFLRPNPTHTVWHDRHTLKRILSMNGFKISKFDFYRGNKRRYIFPKNLLAWRQAMLVVCEKD